MYCNRASYLNFFFSHVKNQGLVTCEIRHAHLPIFELKRCPFPWEPCQAIVFESHNMFNLGQIIHVPRATHKWIFLMLWLMHYVTYACTNAFLNTPMWFPGAHYMH